jgi:hypothetical protein
LFGGADHSFVHSRAVVYAVGFGSEKVFSTKSDLNSTFWGYCTIEDDLKKLVKSTATVRIIGAGDGGLQEALRFALRPEYHDFAKAISELESRIDDSDKEWTNGLRDIMFAEDNAARALMWGYRPELVFSELQTVHDRLIHILLDPLNMSRRKAVIQWRDDVTREQSLKVELVDSHNFSGRVYALNRFLFELLRILSEIQPNNVLIDRNTETTEVTKPDICVDRRGISPIDEAYGTSEKEELLRRVMFRALPNHYSVVA